MMNYLLVVNSAFCTKTAKFWNKNRSTIQTQLPDSIVYVPNSKPYKVPADLDSFDVIALVGDDKFFSLFINSIYYHLSDKTRHKHIAFIPDRKGGVMASSLALPGKLDKQLDLIKKKQSVFLDLIRCHFMDKKGLPRSYFVLNDVIVGIVPSKLPLVVKTLAELALHSPVLGNKKRSKSILVTNGTDVFYTGNYVFSVVLLGNKITNGPRIPSRQKMRLNQSAFEYFQVNSPEASGIKIPLKNFFQKEEVETGFIFSRSFDELSLKGEGLENAIIADGVHLGRIPATFSFLPKALRIIAPMVMIRVTQPWKKAVKPTTVPEPIGRRTGLTRDNEDWYLN